MWMMSAHARHTRACAALRQARHSFQLGFLNEASSPPSCGPINMAAVMLHISAAVGFRTGGPYFFIILHFCGGPDSAWEGAWSTETHSLSCTSRWRRLPLESLPLMVAICTAGTTPYPPSQTNSHTHPSRHLSPGARTKYKGIASANQKTVLHENREGWTHPRFLPSGWHVKIERQWKQFLQN